jgi:hypothetical protein
MSNLAVRGLDEAGTLVTDGLGNPDGVTFTSSLGGSITMNGALSAVFISGVGGELNQGGIRIDIDLGI